MKHIFRLVLILVCALYLSGCSGKDMHEENDPEFYYQLGVEYLKLGKAGEAVEEFKKAIEADPNNIKARQTLGAVYSKMGMNKDALGEYKKVLEVDPKNITALNFIGVIHTKEKEYEKAEKYFKIALEADRNNFFTYNNYGLSLAEAGKTDQAIEMYNRSLEINPEFINAMNTLGQLYLKKGMFKEAIAEFTKALEFNSNSIMTLSNMGIAYHNKGEQDKAIEYHKKVVGLDPKRYFDHLRLGEIYAEMGKFEEAENKFRYAISENPDFGPAYNGLGFLYAKKGEQLEYAEEMINKAIKLAPSNKASYLDSLSWVYYKMEKHNKALETAMAAKELMIKDNASLSLEFKYHLGMIYSKLGEKEKASQYLVEYVEKEKETLRKRIEEYSKYLIELRWIQVYKFQSPEFKIQVSLEEYNRRHPPGGEGRMVYAFIARYDIGKIDIADDMTKADVEFVITRGLKGGLIPGVKMVDPEKPKKEKWEKVNGVWYRSAIPGEVKPALHISGM